MNRLKVWIWKLISSFFILFPFTDAANLIRELRCSQLNIEVPAKKPVKFSENHPDIALISAGWKTIRLSVDPQWSRTGTRSGKCRILQLNGTFCWASALHLNSSQLNAAKCLRTRLDPIALISSSDRIARRTDRREAICKWKRAANLEAISRAAKRRTVNAIASNSRRTSWVAGVPNRLVRIVARKVVRRVQLQRIGVERAPDNAENRWNQRTRPENEIANWTACARRRQLTCIQMSWNNWNPSSPTRALPAERSAGIPGRLRAMPCSPSPVCWSTYPAFTMSSFSTTYRPFCTTRSFSSRLRSRISLSSLPPTTGAHPFAK